MHVDREKQEVIASAFLNEAELMFRRLPGSLQELIDAIPDHNQQLLDAIRAVDEDLYGALSATFDDGDELDLQNSFAFINRLFEIISDMLEQS